MRYRFRAVDTNGGKRSGFRDAASESALRESLRAEGLLPVSVISSHKNFDIGAFALSWPARGMSSAELAIFTRQMATLVSSGVQIEAALATVAEQSPVHVSGFCRSARSTILDGGSLSGAMLQGQSAFGRYYLTSIRAGEQSGRLGTVLAHLAEHVETSQRHRQTVTLALIYPAILIVVSVAVISALLIFVLPDIVRVFAARGAELPPLTRAMIFISDTLARFGIIILAVVLSLGLGGSLLLRRPAARQNLHRLLWRLALVRQIILVQFCGTLSTLAQSGVTLTDALTSATATVGNLHAQSLLRGVARDVSEGMSFSKALSARSGFPRMLITMAASGEASGRLPMMLGRFWSDQSLDLQARIKTIVGLVEPLVLLAMGGIVMLLVLSILMPIVNLNSLVG